MKKNNNSIMRSIKSILLLCFSFMVFSCDIHEKTNNLIEIDSKKTVTIYDYQLFSSDLNIKSLRDSIVTYLDTAVLFGRVYNVFFLKDSAYYEDKLKRFTAPYSYAIERDSFFLMNVYCPIFDTIHLKFKNKTYVLNVSHYDIDNSTDEEMYVYWNYDNGVVALYNYPWNILLLFDSDVQKGFAKVVFYDHFIKAGYRKYNIPIFQNNCQIKTKSLFLPPL